MLRLQVAAIQWVGTVSVTLVQVRPALSPKSPIRARSLSSGAAMRAVTGRAPIVRGTCTRTKEATVQPARHLSSSRPRSFASVLRSDVSMSRQSEQRHMLPSVCCPRPISLSRSPLGTPILSSCVPQRAFTGSRYTRAAPTQDESIAALTQQLSDGKVPHSH